jgi:hypothetical protein
MLFPSNFEGVISLESAIQNVSHQPTIVIKKRGSRKSNTGSKLQCIRCLFFVFSNEM